MLPAEARVTDPQHRVFLELAWAALEDAAILPERFDGPIGVWAGCLSLFETLELCNQEYLHWFPKNNPKQFPVSISLAITLMALVGAFFLTIGLFLFWFLFFRRSDSRGVDSQVQSQRSDSNPYRAPQ